jgi:hypothetical protein
MGKYYWCVKVSKELSDSGEILLHAEDVTIYDDALLFKNEKGQGIFCIAKGQWSCFYAASCIDGGSICVEHWGKGK